MKTTEKLQYQRFDGIDQCDLDRILEFSSVESLRPESKAGAQPCIARLCGNWAENGRFLCPECIKHGVPDTRPKHSRGRVR